MSCWISEACGAFLPGFVAAIAVRLFGYEAEGGRGGHTRGKELSVGGRHDPDAGRKTPGWTNHPVPDAFLSHTCRGAPARWASRPRPEEAGVLHCRRYGREGDHGRAVRDHCGNAAGRLSKRAPGVSDVHTKPKSSLAVAGRTPTSRSGSGIRRCRRRDHQRSRQVRLPFTSCRGVPVSQATAFRSSYDGTV